MTCGSRREQQLDIRLSICLSVCLSVYLSIYLSLCLSPFRRGWCPCTWTTLMEAAIESTCAELVQTIHAEAHWQTTRSCGQARWRTYCILESLGMKLQCN